MAWEGRGERGDGGGGNVTPAVDGVVEGDLGMEAALRQFCFTSGAGGSAVLVRSILSWRGGGHGGGSGEGGSRTDGESIAVR